MGRGRMRADWWVTCGQCYNSEWLDSVDARSLGGLPALAKSKGWKFTKKQGWVCAECQNPNTHADTSVASQEGQK